MKKLLVKNYLFLIALVITGFISSGCSQEDADKSMSLLALLPGGGGGGTRVVLEAPQNLVASDGAFNDRVVVSWDYSEKAQFYRVFRSRSIDADDSEYMVLENEIIFNCYEDNSAEANVTYFYKIQAMHENGESDLSENDSGYIGTFPDSPQNVTASNGTDASEITITWDAVPGAEYYNIYRATSSGGPYSLVSGNVYGTSYDDSVTPGTHYYYKVVAVNSGGSSEFSNSDEGFAEEGEPLAAPTGVSATDRNVCDTGGVTITWTAVAGAQSYTVFRSVSADGDYTAVGPGIAGTSYRDTGVYEDTQYYYRVKAYDPARESMFSACDAGRAELTHLEYLSRFNLNKGYVFSKLSTETGFPPSGLGDPMDYHIDGIISGSVDVNFTVNIFAGTAVSDFIYSEYNDIGMFLNGVENTDTDFDGTGTNSGSVSTSGVNTGTVVTSVHVTDAMPDGGYFDVTYAGITERFDFSDMPDTLLTAPGGIITEGSSGDSIVVSWPPVYGADYYRVYRSASPYGTYVDISGVIPGSVMPEDGTLYTYTDTDVEAGVQYYYRIKAFNSYLFNDMDGDGQSDYDTESPMSDYSGASVQEQNSLTAPQSVNATDGIYADRIAVSWGTVTGADYYRIFRSTVANGEYTQVSGSGDITGTVYEDTDVTGGVTYYYRLKAYNASLESGYSDYDSGIASSGGTGAIEAPENVSASDNAYNDRIVIVWDASENADYYRIYRSGSPGGEYTQISGSGDITATRYDDTSVVAGMTYYYSVRAFNFESSSVYSAQDAGIASTGTVTMVPPETVNASDRTYIDRVEVTWSRVAGADSYRVYRSDSAGGTYSLIGTVSEGTSYSDMNVAPGLYYYSVRSVGLVESDFSDDDAGYRAITKEEFFAEFKTSLESSMDKVPRIGTYTIIPSSVTAYGDTSGSINFRAPLELFDVYEVTIEHGFYNDSGVSLNGITGAEKKLKFIFIIIPHSFFAWKGMIDVSGVHGIYNGTVEIDLEVECLLDSKAGDVEDGFYVVIQPDSPQPSSGQINWDYNN